MGNGLSIRAVLLDMDGLMLDSEPVYRRAWQSAAAGLGYDLSDEFYLALIGRNNRDSEAELVRVFGRDFPLDRFRDDWPLRWQAEVETAGMPVKPGLFGLLELVERHRLPLAVATSSDAEQTVLSLRAAGIDGRFACIVTGDQVSRGKPAPDIFLEAARRLNVAPAGCLVLEDSDAGVIAAATAGMPVLMIPDLKRPSAQAAASAIQVCENLDDASAFLDTYLHPL